MQDWDNVIGWSEHYVQTVPRLAKIKEYIFFYKKGQINI